MYESCMYKIQTDKGVVFINTHTDDCDCLAEHPDDAERVFEECNRLFAHKQSDGITPSENDFLLGNSRKKKVTNGVRSIVISQVAKITELWDVYKDNRKGKRDPTHPYPYNEEHPDLNDQMQAIEVDEDEYSAVLREENYRALTGSLLWITRNSSPALMYGTSITTKCMSKPSLKALGSAHHLLHYAEVHKERGIKFNSHGNLEPICYIDSGLSQFLNFCCFQKAVNRYLYLPFSTATPRHVLSGFIKGELIRYIKRSSQQIGFFKMKTIFWLRLRARGYSVAFLRLAFAAAPCVAR